MAERDDFDRASERRWTEKRNFNERFVNPGKDPSRADWRTSRFVTDRWPSRSSQHFRSIMQGKMSEKNEGVKMASHDKPDLGDNKTKWDDRDKNWRCDIRQKRTLRGHNTSKRRRLSQVLQRKPQREQATKTPSKQFIEMTGSPGNVRHATYLRLNSRSSIEAYEQDMMMRCGISETTKSDIERISLSEKDETVSREDICTELNDSFVDQEDSEGETFADLTWTFGTDNDAIPQDDASPADVNDDDGCIHFENQVSKRNFENFKNDKISGEDLRHLQNQSSEEIVRTFIKFFNKLVNFCSQEVITFKETSLLLAALAKGCKSKRCGESLLKILSEVKDSKFMKAVIPSMLRDIPTMKTEADAKETLMNILILLRYISTIFPSSITFVFGLYDMLQRSISAVFPHARTRDKEFIKEMKIFSDIKATMMERFEKEKQKAQKSKRKIKPPDDFRFLPAFPRLEDINDIPFLRKNKKFGGYEDIDEYLDTQFRLLREDFIQPLRDGIQEYLEYQKNPRIRKSIRVYDNVEILATKWSNEKILHTLQFDVTKLQKINWEYSKRLIYGTLLCLSSDNFQTFYLATVAQSERNELQAGHLTVEFQLDYNEVEALIQTEKFVMLETPAYFEAYKHVLEALQTIDDDMPFAKYIVYCETDCTPPLYLRHSFLNFTSVVGAKQDSPKRKYELIYNRKFLPDSSSVHSHSSVSDSDSDRCSYVNDIDNDNSNESFNSSDSDTEIDMLRDFTQNWPRPDELSLNDGQYKAFKDALSKEFCIIQGPPGTGKTYLGLKIAQTLLANLGLWHNVGERTTGRKCPILLVCHTNHALDQFMEGILRFVDTKDDYNSIVRIGGRSQNEAINKLTLKNRRFDLKWTIPDLYEDRIRISHQLETCHWQIRQCGWQMFELSKGIVHEDVLRPFIGRHFDVLAGRFEERRSNPAILSWLGFQSLVRCSKIRVNKYIQIDNCSAGEYFSKNADLMESKENFLALSLEEIEREYEENTPKAKGTKEQKLRQLSKERRGKLITKLNQNLQMNSKMVEAEAVKVKYIWNLKNMERWRLYRFWLHKLREYLTRKRQDDLKQNLEKFNEKVKEYEAASREIDCRILQRAKVIGMTTTGAARNRELLKTIGPRIVIIEEAAEVLESHTVTSIYPGCEHLILIGDHQQLRPNPNVYRLAKQYNLDISLFERMANNGHKTNTLTLQHRMRPCISRLMKHIYLKLEDHPSVDMYDDIKGVGKNLFFINHSEKERDGEDSLSHANDFEASYLARLCKYLLLQGYKYSQITILSTYLAQVSCIRKLLPKPEYKDVMVTAVDNFQGEENDIILLSLVRSNEEEKVGFLKTENRVCVALSRAKMGMYVIGNFDVLSKKSDMWGRIVKDVKGENEFGPGLPLFCQNHTNDEGIVALKAQDFDKAPDGGCMKKCDFRLDCGHVCRLSCHPVDREHKDYMCKKVCLKKCPRDHPCKDLCYEKCSDCTVLIPKTLPLCNHIQEGHCCVKPEDEKCRHPCDRKCPKGHPCPKLCHKKCGDCMVVVPKTLPTCGHSIEGKCYVEPEREVCLNPCERTCSEGHKCEKKCSDSCGRCMVEITKIIPKCGHSATVACYTEPNDITCQNRCEKTCPLGHQCERKCSETCEKCFVQVSKTVPQCGHSQTVDCFLDPKNILCQTPCERTCSEGHNCKKKCFEACGRCSHQCEKTCPYGHPCQKMCSEDCYPCPTEVEKVLPNCGHIQNVECSVNPDKVKCQTQCEENVPSCGHKCGRLCGEKCKCNAFILRTLKCGHEGRISCEDRYEKDPDCTVRCRTTLKCGHLCEGSCKECSRGRLHRKCRMTHNCLLVCGHEGVIKGSFTEQCSKPCPVYCSHGPCHNSCGKPCSRCRVRVCSWQCPHLRCRKRCNDYSNRPPCPRVCNKPLPCKHRCVGLCGERCPKECKICDRDEFPDSFMGRPVDQGARYVSLIDCDHTLEVSFLDFWMSQNVNKHGLEVVGHRRCPFCLTPIRNSHRYGNFIKRIDDDLDKIYRMFKDMFKKVEKSNTDLEMNHMDMSSVPLFLSSVIQKALKKELCQLETRLQSTFQIDADIEAVQSDIIYLKDQLLEEGNCITEQEHYDTKNEVKRLKILVFLLEVKHGVRPHTSKDKDDIQQKLEIKKTKKERYLRMYTRYKSRVYLNLCDTAQMDIDLLEVQLDQMNKELEDADPGKLSDAQEAAVTSCIRLLQRQGTPLPRVYASIEEVVRTLPGQMDASFSCNIDVTDYPRPFIYGCWFKCHQGHIFFDGTLHQRPVHEDVKCPECKHQY